MADVTGTCEARFGAVRDALAANLDSGEDLGGVDLVLGVPLRFGIGYGLPQRDTIPYIPEGRVAFWGGWGGSLVVADLDRRMTFAYMMNRMGAGIVGSPRSAQYLSAAYAALG